jgi:hypothetical protein
MKVNYIFKLLVIILLVLLFILIKRNIIEYFNINKCLGYSFKNCNLKECMYNENCSEITYKPKSYDYDLNLNKNLRMYNVNKDEKIKEIYVVNYNNNNSTNFSQKEVELYKFNGKNTYLYLTDFNGEKISVSLFIKLLENTVDEIPLITTSKLRVVLALNKNTGGYKIKVVLVLNINTGGYKIKLSLIDDDKSIIFENNEIKKNELNYISLSINSKNCKLLLLNSTNTVNNINEEVKENKIIEKETLVSPNILIGTDIERKNYLNGYIGNLRISREDYTEEQGKIDSGYYREKKEILEEGVIDLISEQEAPNKLSLVAQYDGKNINIYWTRPSVGYNTLKRYILAVKEGKKPYRLYVIKNNNDCEKCSYVLKNIITDIEYKIAIYGENKKRSEISEIINITPKDIEEEDTTIKNQRIPFVSCNPDGTYNISNNCNVRPSLIIDVNEEENKELEKKLEKRQVKKILAKFNI